MLGQRVCNLLWHKGWNFNFAVREIINILLIKEVFQNTVDLPFC